MRGKLISPIAWVNCDEQATFSVLWPFGLDRLSAELLNRKHRVRILSLTNAHENPNQSRDCQSTG
jgi:hypothetical protein